MKILLNANYDHPLSQGGVSTFNRNILNIFKNYDLTVLSYATMKEKIYKVDCNKIIEIYNFNKIIKSFDARILKYKLQKFIVRKNIKKIKPDVCIINSLEDIEILRDLKTKVILIQHTDFKIYFQKYFYKKNSALIDEISKKLDCFICLSEESKMKFVQELKLPKEKIKVIKHMAEIELLELKKQKNKNLIMLTRLSSEKQIDLVIKAMEKLPEYNLNIYGDGDEKEKLKKLIREKKLNNVRVCGITNQVKKVLDNSGIFVMSSSFEGYPISSIEAMRRGLPIVLRNTFDSAKDIVKENGILLQKEWDEVEFIKAIKKIYDNYEYYSENSKKLGIRYDSQKIKQEWIELLEELKK